MAWSSSDLHILFARRQGLRRWITFGGAFSVRDNQQFGNMTESCQLTERNENDVASEIGGI